MPPSAPLPGGAEAAHAERLFALSQDLLGAADADGYLRWVNAAWERTMGWTPEELFARPYLDFMHPEDRAKVIAFAERLEHMPRGESLQIEARARRQATARYRWLRCSAAVADGAGAARLPLRHRRHRPARGARAARGRADAVGPPHGGARALQRRAGALRLGRLARPAPVADRGLRVPGAAREPPRRRAADGRRRGCSALAREGARAHALARRGSARVRARGSLRPRPGARRRRRARAPARADRRRRARCWRSASCPSCSRARASSSSCWPT